MIHLTHIMFVRLTAEESEAHQEKESAESNSVNITGQSYETAQEEFNRIYLENRWWGDSFSMVPPTR
jgi:hypothetical protein